MVSIFFEKSSTHTRACRHCPSRAERTCAALFVVVFYLLRKRRAVGEGMISPSGGPPMDADLMVNFACTAFVAAPRLVCFQPSLGRKYPCMVRYTRRLTSTHPSDIVLFPSSSVPNSPHPRPSRACFEFQSGSSRACLKFNVGQPQEIEPANCRDRVAKHRGETDFWEIFQRNHRRSRVA